MKKRPDFLIFRFATFIASYRIKAKRSHLKISRSTMVVAGKKPCILHMGCTPSIVYPLNERLLELGLEGSVGLVVADNEKTYRQLSELVRSEHFDGFFVGYGVRGNRAWFEKVLATVAEADPNLPLLDHKGPSDLISAIERQFNVKISP